MAYLYCTPLQLLPTYGVETRETGRLKAVVQCIYCAREQGVLSSFYTLEGGNGSQEKKGTRHASQDAITRRFSTTIVRYVRS